MSVTFKRSSNFERNFNSKAIAKQVEKNTFKANEVLKDTSNQIAPIKTGNLRQNTTQKQTTSLTRVTINVSWNQPYAAKRYESNKTNPSTTKWVEKAYERKKSTLLSIQNEDLFK